FSRSGDRRAGSQDPAGWSPGHNTRGRGDLAPRRRGKIGTLVRPRAGGMRADHRPHWATLTSVLAFRGLLPDGGTPASGHPYRKATASLAAVMPVEANRG